MSALPTHFPPPPASAHPDLHFHAPSPELSSHPPSEIPHPTSPIPNSEIPSSHPTFLADLSNPSLSLRQVAEKHNTTVDALSVLLTDPAIAASIDALESTGARRARLIVSVALPQVAHSLLKQLNAANADLDLASQAPTQANSNTTPIPNTLRGYILRLRLRARESARKTAAALMSVARFHPGATKPRSSETPSLKEGPDGRRGGIESGTPGGSENRTSQHHSEEPAPASFSPSRSEQKHDLTRNEFEANPKTPSSTQSPTAKLASHKNSTPSETENKLAAPRSEEFTQTSFSPSQSEQAQALAFTPPQNAPSSETGSFQRSAADSLANPVSNFAADPTHNATPYAQSNFNDPNHTDQNLTEAHLAALANPIIEAIKNSDPDLLANLSTHQAQSLILQITTEIALNDKLPPPSDDQLLPLITTRLRHILSQPSGP